MPVDVAVAQRCMEAVTARVMPGAVYAVITPAGVTSGAVGATTYDPDAATMTTEHVFDVASLTKLIGPMSVAAQLLDEGVLTLDTPVAEFLPAFRDDQIKAAVRVRHLMTYTVDFQYDDAVRAHLCRGDSGAPLPPLEFLETLLALLLRCAPGTSYQYSDITAIALTQLIECATGRSLAELCAERFFAPLGMHDATFTAEAIPRARVVSTEVTHERGLVWGAVHDEKAAWLQSGGITAGSAGLFASVGDVARYLELVIGGGVWQGERYFSESIVNAWTSDQFPSINAHTPLMWGDRFGQPGNQYQNRAYATSLYADYPGRLVTKGGFTGCFMAADLDRQRAVVVLGNVVHPHRPEHPRAFNAVKEDLVARLAAV